MQAEANDQRAETKLRKLNCKTTRHPAIEYAHVVARSSFCVNRFVWPISTEERLHGLYPFACLFREYHMS